MDNEKTSMLINDEFTELSETKPIDDKQKPIQKAGINDSFQLGSCSFICF